MQEYELASGSLAHFYKGESEGHKPAADHGEVITDYHHPFKESWKSELERDVKNAVRS